VGVLDRQQRRVPFGASTVQGNTPYGRSVVADRGAPLKPLQDVPTNDPTPATEDNPAGDVPFTQGMRDQFANPDRSDPAPVIRDAATAFMLADRLKTMGKEKLGASYDRGVRALATFNQQYPGAMGAYREQLAQTRWMDENLDTTPHKSSRLTAAQRSATAQRARAEGFEPTIASMAAARDIPIPKTIEELPKLEPGSRAAVLEREESLGLDTTSGITSFSEKFNLARKVNGSETQARMLYALAADNLEHAGITLPKGVDPVNYNEDIGQLEALVPTEDGKVKRVLVDPEFFRPQDLGGVADIEELFAMTGATLSQITGGGAARVANRFATKHPAIAEFVGDFGWRNTGIVLEGLLDAEALGGDTTLQDVADALDKSDNFGESATGTAFSRVLGRLTGQRATKSDVDVDLQQFRKKGMTDDEAAAAAEQEVRSNLDEAADTLEEVQKLTDKPFTTTKAEASGSLEEIATQKGREARLTAAEQTKINIRRDTNRAALSDAVDNIHNNRLPTNVVSSPHQTAAKVESQLTAKGDAASDISVKVGSYNDTYGAVEVYTWKWNQGSDSVNMKGLGKPTDELQQGFQNDLTGVGSGADVRVDHGAKTVTIKYVGEDESFPGGAAIMMDRMMKDLGDIPSDYRWVSDNQLSQYSMAMAARLEKEGFGIKMNDGVYTERDGDVLWTRGPALEPVYEITHIPGKMMRVPLAADSAEYSAARVADTLDDDLAYVANGKAHAEFWGVKWQSQIGWQADRQKSIYSIANPRTSKLNRMAKQLEARIERSLTGMDASAADRTLGQVFRKQVDEDGYPIIEGLTNDTLDIGHLGRSRDSLRALYERTKDPEVGLMLDTVEDMMKNGKILDNFGNAVDEGTGTALRGTWERLNETTDILRHAESAVTSNPLFAKNRDGQYINIELKEMGNALRNGSKFLQHISPWMNSNPSGQMHVREALMSLYTDSVLGGTGFTAAKHHTFLRNYSTSLRSVFSEGDMAEFAATNFTKEGRNILADRAAASRSAMNRLEQFGTLTPGKMVESLTEIGKTGNPRKRTMTYMRELKRMDPQLAEQVRIESLVENKRMINERFFSDTASQNPAKSADSFKKYIDEHEHALRALHGDQYVTDLKNTWRGLHLDTQRFRIGAATPELQGDVIRTSRTLMGPLNVWQRRVSASNWIRLRWHSKKAVEAVADPEKLRHLTLAAGVPSRSRPGIAALVRAGILPGTGWDGAGEMPEDVYQKGLEFNEWLQSVSDELQSEKVEPE
jgi:hypothetical protein